MWVPYELIKLNKPTCFSYLLRNRFMGLFHNIVVALPTHIASCGAKLAVSPPNAPSSTGAVYGHRLVQIPLDFFDCLNNPILGQPDVRSVTKVAVSNGKVLISRQDAGFAPNGSIPAVAHEFAVFHTELELSR
jgi:hypothetical protein